MKVPKNIIKTGKYTSGGEFYFKITQAPYKGYYYAINNKYYAGKEYDEKAPEIVKIQQANNLLFRGSTALFSILSGVTSQMLKPTKVTSTHPNIESNQVTIRYFSQKVNVRPTIIKEISKETYDSLQGDPLYITTFIGPTQNIDQAEKQMPGLKAFLSV